VASNALTHSEEGELTLVVATVVRDAIVVGADSRTSAVFGPNGQWRIGTDYADKLFQIHNYAVGTAGAAVLAGRSIASHMEDVGAALPIGASFDALCVALEAHFQALHAAEIARLQPGSPTAGLDTYFLVAGYDAGRGRVDRIYFTAPAVGVPTVVERRTQIAPGILSVAWIGNIEYCERLIFGYSTSMFAPGLVPAQVDQLIRQTEARVPYDLYTVQDAMDLTSFLFQATMFMQRAQINRPAIINTDYPNVGGEVDYARIGPGRFDWIVRKAERVRQVLPDPPRMDPPGS
jgi:hypothetical protein